MSHKNQKHYTTREDLGALNEFQEMLRQVLGLVGTDSLKKFPATWATEHVATDPK
jgi:hypothetical protein